MNGWIRPLFNFIVPSNCPAMRLGDHSMLSAFPTDDRNASSRCAQARSKLRRHIEPSDFSLNQSFPIRKADSSRFVMTSTGRRPRARVFWISMCLILGLRS